MKQVGEWIDQALDSGGDEALLARVRRQVQDMCEQFLTPDASHQLICRNG